LASPSEVFITPRPRDRGIPQDGVPHRPAAGGRRGAAPPRPRRRGGIAQVPRPGDCGGGAALLRVVRADLPRLVPQPPHAPQRLLLHEPRRRRVRQDLRGALRIRSRRRAAPHRLPPRPPGERPHRSLPPSCLVALAGSLRRDASVVLPFCRDGSALS
jgi:hypothetical protein